MPLRLAHLLVACASLATSSASAITRRSLEQHEASTSLPDGWLYHSEAGHDDVLTLSVLISHPDETYLEIAKDVTDPDSANYGRYLSADQLKAISPDLTHRASSVSSWLKEHDVVHSALIDDSLYFETTVGHARKLLGADFKYYQYGMDEPVLRTQQYSVPSALRNTIDFIHPTVHFMRGNTPIEAPRLEARQHIPTGTVDCSNSVCPLNITNHYNITYRPKDGKSGANLAIAGFLEQYPDHDDVQAFLKAYGTGKYDANYDYKVVTLNGGKDPNNASTSGAEALLDVQFGMGIASPLPVTYFSVGGRPPTLSQPNNTVVPKNESGNEPYLALFKHLLAMKKPPTVLSISYTDDEQTVPLKFATSVCNAAAKLAARGVTIIVASGDGGAAGTSATNCEGPDGKARFIPTFPASCPWVTAVGAIASYGGAAHYTGGGFSNYFARPGFQDPYVKEYIKALNGTHNGFYNSSGRGFPDVSLWGDEYLTLGDGYTYNQKGTSASAPVFAAMIALLNDKRIRAGKPVLGFLNPLIYAAKAAKGFTDVTDGSLDGCYDGTNVEVGYTAITGWDAASGLGEPNFATLLKILT